MEKKTTKPLGGYDRIFAGREEIPAPPLNRPWLCMERNLPDKPCGGYNCRLCGGSSDEYQLCIVAISGDVYPIGCMSCVDGLTTDVVDFMDSKEEGLSGDDADHGSVSEDEKCEADVAVSDDEGSAGEVEIRGGGDTGDDLSSDEWGSDDAPHKRKATKQKNNENKKKKIKK